MDFSLIRSHVSWCGLAWLIMMRPLLLREQERTGAAGREREREGMSEERDGMRRVVEGRRWREGAGRDRGRRRDGGREVKNTLRPTCEAAFCSPVQKHTGHYLF